MNPIWPSCMIFWYVISSKLVIFCGGWLYLVIGVLWIKALLSGCVIRQPCSCVNIKAYTYTNWRHSQRCSVMRSYEITVRHKVHRCVKYHYRQRECTLIRTINCRGFSRCFCLTGISVNNTLLKIKKCSFLLYFISL